MDDIVKQAMAKWPNVPHCYGWLALDARGNWRMRDERAQTLKLPGERIANAALLGFINRNYTHDEDGRWYFQNGPQRVYVNLETTPYVARTDPQHGFVVHTGEALERLDGAWLTEAGILILQSGEKVAAIDDRDIAQCLPMLRVENRPVSDEQLLAWLAEPNGGGSLTLHYGAQHVEVKPIAGAVLADNFGFVREPQASRPHGA
jgi:hypothetical protein